MRKLCLVGDNRQRTKLKAKSTQWSSFLIPASSSSTSNWKWKPENRKQNKARERKIRFWSSVFCNIWLHCATHFIMFIEIEFATGQNFVFIYPWNESCSSTFCSLQAYETLGLEKKRQPFLDHFWFLFHFSCLFQEFFELFTRRF